MALKQDLRAPSPSVGEGVTMLELFFDLVFVFTITQLTAVVRESHGAVGYLHAGAILAITWWMYDGYAWLSNNVGPNSVSTRIPMLVGMTGFLVMAIATPDAFGTAAWPFALAYLVVVLVHAVQFARSSQGDSARAIRRILPINLAAPLLLVGAAMLGADKGWILWAVTAAMLLAALAPRSSRGFSLRAGHFAERHQLVIIIALGETIVATGVGAQGRLREAAVLVAVLLAMAFVSALWWVYFGGDDEAGADALADSLVDGGVGLGAWAYAGAHVFHVAGLVLVAAGLEEIMVAPTHQLSVRIAMTMTAGCATFLAGQALYLRLLALPGGPPLLIGGGLALVAGGIGHLVNGLTELSVLVVLLVCTVAVRAVQRGRPRPSSAGSP
ncbi:MAG: low temperature requirement protein A [Actinomycetota bacterium]|nr:low temperature requirement protein A [Actinomycetota bacterium]